MAYSKQQIIWKIKKKIEMELINQLALYRKRLRNKFSVSPYREPTEQEMVESKVIFTGEELEFVINNYKKVFDKNQLLENCIFLLNEYKQTNQTSKYNAVCSILNKYFTIENYYNDDPFRSLTPFWDGFKITTYIECPLGLEELIQDKVNKVKVEKQIKEYKDSADKIDQKIIEELEF